MKYSNGLDAKLGDKVKLQNGEFGEVVISFDTHEYSEGFSEKDWRSLRKGIMIRAENNALVRFDDSDSEEVAFISGHAFSD